MKATHSTESTGLGSLQGIRWLLAVGALVLAVSVYRLVEAQWAGMPVTAQFLTLVAGSFGIFGAGELLKNRLRLPIAGSALQLLFSVLVPVLSWGAAYLDLLSAPGGAVVYGVSILALLSAFRRCLREALRYDGLLYPVTFSLLTVSLPLLSLLPSLSLMNVTGWGYIFAAISLGGVFHIGSQHINRFLFHRDRRAADGCVDRPVRALPFLALTVLYAASLSILKLPLSCIALPIVILGVALVTTGEEYFYALVRSLRARPSTWPRRSVAFLAVGFALVVVAGPLAFLDASGRVPAIVFCAIAALLFRWSFRYRNVPAHVFAMCASVVGYAFLSALMPQVAVETVVSLTDILGLVAPAAKLSFGQLGLALLFTALARQFQRAGRAHAMCASVHLIAIVALSGFAGATIVAPLALALAFLSVFIARRREWLPAAHAALGASILAWGGAYGMELLAVVMIGVVSLSRGSRYLTWPAFFWAGVIGISGVISFTSGGALEVLFAGVLLLALGHRLGLAPVIVAGIGALSLGVHGELAFTYAASSVTIVAATQTLFAASVVVLRWANARWALGAHLSVLGHGALGVLWLFVALANGSIGVTIEPVILALFGWAILWHGLREKDETDSAVGLGFLVTYVPLHLAALGLVESVPVLLLMTLGCVLVARALAPRFLAPSVERLVRFWRMTAVVAALGFVGTGVSGGTGALALAVTVALVGAFYGKVPYRSLLLVLAHGLIWFTGAASYEFFPLALVEAITSGFPLFAALVLGWILLVEARGVNPLQLWTTALECFVVSGYFMGFAPTEIFTTWDYGAMLAIAAAFATRHALRSLHHQNAGHAWAMQAWLALGVLVGFYAGWVSFGNGRAPYVLLAMGVAQYGLAALWMRAERGQPLAWSSIVAGQTLVLLGGAVALVRWQPWPLFLASVFYLILASRESKRVLPSVLSVSFLGFGLLAIASGQGVGLEFYSLAPGFTLVALALLLSEEMGPRWSRHVFTAGAAFIYATPVLALYDEITWAWQAVLLLLTVGFGTASFWLRSRPLLTVSTAALVIDLACFVIMIRATEPLLLWVGGVFLGIAIMTFASYLEYRREGLAQQIRVFGRQLAGWY